MNKKNILIIILTLIIIILLTVILVLIKNKNTNKELKNNNKNSVLEIKEKNEESETNIVKEEKDNKKDTVLTETKTKVESKKKTTLTEATSEVAAKKENTISNNEESVINEQSSNINENNMTDQKTKEINEDNIIEEFLTMQQQINNTVYDKASTFLSKVGDKVATMIGFIWYDEEIKGVTYKELSETAKNKILSIYYSVDAKIENKIPNYKDKIKYKYKVISNFIKDKYDDLKYNVDSWLLDTLGKEKYNEYLEMTKELKEGANNSVQDIKDVGTFYKEKIKEWYQKKKS